MQKSNSTEGGEIVAILGMHRSGTSCLTGILQEAGLYLGEVVTWAPHNLKGNRENIGIRELNDQVLKVNNADWDNPRIVSSWPDYLAVRRDRILNSFVSGNVQKWGFKDPRTTFTYPFWQQAVPLKFIGTYRHPRLVAASLSARNGWKMERGLELWFDYNSTMLELWRQKNFPVIRFDQHSGKYISDVKTILELLGLSPKGVRFFDSELVHQSIDEQNLFAPLPDRIEQLWQDMLLHYSKTI